MIKYSAIKENDSYKVKIDQKYEDIYDALGDRASKCKVFDNKISVFVFAAAVGYKKGIIKELMTACSSSNALHCQPITEQQLASLLAIIINDDKIGKNFDNFLDNEYLSKGLHLAEKYAQGGMEVLCEKVFEEQWNGTTLSREYSDYGADLLRFIVQEKKEPF